jgi:YidC/Oxa1 family membrane protein insertase
MDIFTILFYQPIYNLVIVLYRVFGGDLGLAIIAIAVLSRLITLPITLRQIKMAEGNKEFNAKIKSIKEQYKNDKDKQSQELMKIQSEYLPSQLAGCLPLILQFIFLINILNVVQDIITNSAGKFNSLAYSFVPQLAANEVMNTNFLGVVNLAVSPAHVGYENLLAVAPYIILALLVGLTQYLSTQILMGNRTKKEESAEIKTEKTKKTTKKGKSEQPEDFSEIMQQSTKQTMLILPILLIFMSLNFPAGLSLYWTVQSGFVIIQQLIIERLKPNQK